MKNRLACAALVAAIVSTASVSAENWEVPAKKKGPPAAALVVAFVPPAGVPAEKGEVPPLVRGGAFHGVPGLAIDKAGLLFAAGAAGGALWGADIAGGSRKVATPAP